VCFRNFFISRLDSQGHNKQKKRLLLGLKRKMAKTVVKENTNVSMENASSLFSVETHTALTAINCNTGTTSYRVRATFSKVQY